jgi:hypothetical protein
MWRARRMYLLLVHQSVVFGVAADPNPENSIRQLHTDGTVVDADTRRPKAAGFLEMERGMFGVCLEQHKRSIRMLLY